MAKKEKLLLMAALSALPQPVIWAHVNIFVQALDSLDTSAHLLEKADQVRLRKGLTDNALNVLSGQMAGVNVTSNGLDRMAMLNSVRMRGTTSITGSNDPLVIIDGVTSDIATLSTIYPADIESFNILKNAAETATYGSRGASGVIEVKTKKGTGRGFQISYEGNYGLQGMYKHPEMLDAQEYQSTARRIGTPCNNGGYDTDFYQVITRSVADFLLAKLALNAEVYDNDDWTDGMTLDGRALYFQVDGRQMNAWQTCVYYCDQLRQNGYVLEPRYADNFAVHNEMSTEDIFTVPMNKMIYSNQMWYIFRSIHYQHGETYGLGGENGTSATLTTMRVYGYGTDEVDARFEDNFFADTVWASGSENSCGRDGTARTWCASDSSTRLMTSGNPSRARKAALPPCSPSPRNASTSTRISARTRDMTSPERAGRKKSL